MELKTPEYYEKLVQERYKNIEKTVLENGMIIFECWKDETKSIEYYVKVIFDGDVVYYHGDMGTYVFNKNIHNALRFFSWEINLPYWEEKLEAAFRPSTIEEIDLDELEAKLIETLKDEGIDLDSVDEDGDKKYEDLLDDIHFAFFNIHEHYIAAYNKLYDALKDEWPLDDFVEDLNHAVNYCRHKDQTFMYCCALLHHLVKNFGGDDNGNN